MGHGDVKVRLQGVEHKESSKSSGPWKSFNEDEGERGDGVLIRNGVLIV